MNKKHEAFSDSEIIDALFSRDEKAISMISSRYGKYLYTIAYNILGNDEDAKECVSDAYLRIWERIPPDNPRSFKTYAAVCQKSVAINRYKEKARDKRIVSEYAGCLEEMSEFLPDPVTVDDDYKNGLLKRAIRDFFDSLSERRRYIFVCRYYCGDSIDSIAKALKISGSMVFRELADIRKKLKEKLVMEDLWNE